MKRLSAACLALLLVGFVAFSYSHQASGMTGISAPPQVSRSAYRADGIERQAGPRLTVVAFNFEPSVSTIEALRDGRQGDGPSSRE